MPHTTIVLFCSSLFFQPEKIEKKTALNTEHQRVPHDEHCRHCCWCWFTPTSVIAKPAPVSRVLKSQKRHYDRKANGHILMLSVTPSTKKQKSQKKIARPSTCTFFAALYTAVIIPSFYLDDPWSQRFPIPVAPPSYCIVFDFIAIYPNVQHSLPRLADVPSDCAYRVYARSCAFTHKKKHQRQVRTRNFRITALHLNTQHLSIKQNSDI